MCVLHKLNSIIVVSLFSVAIFVPFFVGIIEKDKDISVLEKRKLAPFPRLEKISDIRKFPKLFDEYYSDHFGLRNWFTHYYKLIKFNLGDSPSPDVTIGKEGWLFLGSIKRGYKKYSDPIGDARNINLFSKSDLKKFGKYMRALKAWLDDRHIKYIFIIAPNKHTIYFDKLPSYISKENKYSATDQLVEYLKENTEISVVDLRKVIIEQKEKHQLYYKTDTHWNHWAANIAQYEIMSAIEKFFPNQINPEIMNLKVGFRGGGDLSNFIGVYNFKEEDPYPIFEHSCTPIRHPKDAEGRKTHSFTCEGQKLNALIFRDSFFRALEPYFARKFKHSTYIWEKLNYSSLDKYVRSQHPDIIIEEWVERSLPLVPNIAPEFLYAYNKRLFDRAVESIFFNEFDKLSYNSIIKMMDNGNKFTKMKSIGENPIIKFPPLPFEKAAQYVIHIEFTSSVNSVLQIFYSDSEEPGCPFSEKKSIRKEVKAGYNDFYILLDYDKLGRWLRLDPISGIGQFKIKTIEIRKVDS